MGNLPWWKLQIQVEQHVWYINILYALDFHLARPRPCLINIRAHILLFSRVLINICDFNAREIFLVRAAGLGLFLLFQCNIALNILYICWTNKKYASFLYWGGSMTRLMSSVILVSLLAMQATRNLTDVWLAHWVTQAQHNGTQPNISFFRSVQSTLRMFCCLFILEVLSRGNETGAALFWLSGTITGMHSGSGTGFGYGITDRT